MNTGSCILCRGLVSLPSVFALMTRGCHGENPVGKLHGPVASLREMCKRACSWDHPEDRHVECEHPCSGGSITEPLCLPHLAFLPSWSPHSPCMYPRASLSVTLQRGSVHLLHNLGFKLKNKHQNPLRCNLSDCKNSFLLPDTLPSHGQPTGIRCNENQNKIRGYQPF